MSKELKKLIALVVVLGLCVGGYFWLKDWNSKASQREAAKAVYVSQFGNVDQFTVTKKGGTPITFVKTDNKWTYPADSTFPVNDSKLNNIAGYLMALKAVKTIDKPDDLSSYGLKDPEETIEVKSGDATEKILIGAVNDTNRYAMKDGESAVYTVSPTVYDDTATDINGFAQLETFPVLSEANIKSIELKKADGTDTKMTKETVVTPAEDSMKEAVSGTTVAGPAEEPTEAPTPATPVPTATPTVTYQWSLADGTPVASSDAILSSYLSTLKALSFKACANYKADDAALTTYGLDSPAVLTVEYDNGTFALSIGKAADDSTAYVRLNDSKIVYTMDKKTTDALQGIQENTAK